MDHNTQTIMVLNPKGGSGKSTIATNLAGYLANFGVRVALADYDAQQTSLSWLQNRDPSKPYIYGTKPVSGKISVPPDVDYLVMDTPAALDSKSLPDWLVMADILLIPVLPSPIDIRTARYLVYQLMLKFRTTSYDKRIGMIANRARVRTSVYQSLIQFTTQVNIPLLTTLKDSANYLRAMEQGLSIFDMGSQSARADIEQWIPLTNWLHQPN